MALYSQFRSSKIGLCTSIALAATLVIFEAASLHAQATSEKVYNRDIAKKFVSKYDSILKSYECKRKLKKYELRDSKCNRAFEGLLFNAFQLSEYNIINEYGDDYGHYTDPFCNEFSWYNPYEKKYYNYGLNYYLFLSIYRENMFGRAGDLSALMPAVGCSYYTDYRYNNNLIRNDLPKDKKEVYEFAISKLKGKDKTELKRFYENILIPYQKARNGIYNKFPDIYKRIKQSEFYALMYTLNKNAYITTKNMKFQSIYINFTERQMNEYMYFLKNNEKYK